MAIYFGMKRLSDQSVCNNKGSALTNGFSLKDRLFFVKLIVIVILILGLATFLPLFAEGGKELSVVLTLTSVFFIMIAIILWCSFLIKYVFLQDYLFVKGGPFGSRIPYDSIANVSLISSIFVGYRILSSRDAIEILYRTSLMGNVKISPKDQKAFIAELKKRCPNLLIEE